MTIQHPTRPRPQVNALLFDLVFGEPSAPRREITPIPVQAAQFHANGDTARLQADEAAAPSKAGQGAAQSQADPKAAPELQVDEEAEADKQQDGAQSANLQQLVGAPPGAAGGGMAAVAAGPGGEAESKPVCEADVIAVRVSGAPAVADV